MADDGELIINTPNAFALHRILRYLRHPARLHDFFDPRNLQDLHFNTYDYLTLEKTLNFTGLKIVELIPNRLTPPLTWSLRWFDPVKRLLSRGLPKFSDNLLVRCVKCDPIDVASQVVHWRKTVR